MVDLKGNYREYMNIEKIIEQYVKSEKKVKIKTSTLDNTDILIEGDASSLEFLGEIILSLAKDEKNKCSYSISPTGSGNAFFEKGSTHGIYIHRLPCNEKK